MDSRGALVNVPPPFLVSLRGLWVQAGETGLPGHCSTRLASHPGPAQV